MAKYLDTKSLLALDNVGDGDTQINTDKLAPAAIDAFTADGELYAVPANIATLQLYYNKALFEAAGIDGPPTTVDEFRTASTAFRWPTTRRSRCGRSCSGSTAAAS